MKVYRYRFLDVKRWREMSKNTYEGTFAKPPAPARKSNHCWYNAL